MTVSSLIFTRITTVDPCPQPPHLTESQLLAGRSKTIPSREPETKVYPLFWKTEATACRMFSSVAPEMRTEAWLPLPGCAVDWQPPSNDRASNIVTLLKVMNVRTGTNIASRVVDLNAFIYWQPNYRITSGGQRPAIHSWFKLSSVRTLCPGQAR